MAITPSYGKYTLYCNICESEVDETFGSFDDAVTWANEEGWKRRKVGNEWENICPECQ
jgi:hypothetical protein